MATNDTQLMDEEEMIMTINGNNSHDDHDDGDEALLDDMETDDEVRDEAADNDDSIIILKIQPNIVLNEHDPNHCFYIKCQARATTLRQVQEILFAFCLVNGHSNNNNNNDDDENYDDAVRQTLQYYHQQCHYSYSGSSSMPNSLHNPLVFIHPKPNDHDDFIKSRDDAVVVHHHHHHHDDNHHHPIIHHRRYQIRFILMGQLLSTCADHQNHNGDDDSLASIPQVMKLLAAASTFHDDDDDDFPVITIHAVVTKRRLHDTTTTTTATATATPVLPPPSLQQQQQSLVPNRIEPEDDDDLLFYPEDDDDEDDSDDDTNAETDRHLVSLFINDDDDDDDNDESDSSVVERDDHHRHDTVDAANNTTTTRSSPPHNRNANHNRNRNIPLGFDALRVTAGLNRHDITILRLYFNQDIDQWIQQQHRQNSSGRTTSQLLFPTTNLNNNDNNGTTMNNDNNAVDTLRLRRLQEEAWMNVQGPYSEFRYNVNAPLLHLQQQQQQQRVGGVRRHQRSGSRIDNIHSETTSVVSPLLALPLPPSPATTDNDNNNGHRRSHNHLSDSGTPLTTTASLTRAIRNRVTSGSPDAVTMYRRAAGRQASGRPGSTILPLHNGGTNSPGSGNHHAMPASIGSDRDFLYGVIFGSMVGSGMLLWIWIPTVSYKQKLGILFGYALHITMNMIHKSLRSDENFEGDHNMISPDDIHYHNYRYSKNFLINDDTLQLGE